ncbi:MAG: glycosyltransferase family 2 protein [Pseudomonadota bacterium]
MKSHPLISVCIPAYNRAENLTELLESILSQDFEDFEIVICEDFSPQRESIRLITQEYLISNPSKIRYFENYKNFGYDRNFRELVSKSQGDFCVFVGNDDLLEVGALSHIADCLNKAENPGAFLRTYRSFSGSKDSPGELFRYFPNFQVFPPGIETVGVFFRRFVVISGLGIHRETANLVATDRFDGTLLYQLYLVSKVLLQREGVYSPRSVALYRTGGTPDFGNSELEKGKFVPGVQTPESSIHFIEGLIRIAKDISQDYPNLFSIIMKDMRAYSYPLLSIQANQSFLVFLGYTIKLAKLGFATSIYFWFYFIVLSFLGPKRTNRLILLIKNRLGYTPKL